MFSLPVRSLLPLLLLFFSGGCAALIYEVVWFQLLEFAIGASSVSLAVLLGTFMAGMGLGSLLMPRLVSARRHPLRVYALMEFSIAISAVLVWFALPAAGRLYAQVSGGHGSSAVFWRATLCVLFLLPPTMLMGATLPAIARWTKTTPAGVTRLGYCYAANIAGAVSGTLFAAFYLLRVHDLAIATACAAVINVLAAVIALVLARRSPGTSEETPGELVSPTSASPSGRGLAVVVTSIALSGFCAMAAQVIWTRLLAFMLGATVYTFALVLAAFLIGSGIGSVIGARFARKTRRPRSVLGVCQLLQVVTLIWADDLLTHTLPFLPGGAPADSAAVARFLSDLGRAAAAVLPATIIWGASLPLAIAAASGAATDPARIVGRIYAANTAGAVLGAVLAGLVLLPGLGTAHTESLLIACAITSALLLLRPASLRGRLGLATAIGLAIWLGANVSPVPWQLVAYGRHAAQGDQSPRVLYLGEGAQTTVAVTENRLGTRYFHVSGKTEASSHFYDMRLQRMLGHLPTLFHPAPRSVLVVGCGSGVTAGSFALYPSVERIVICEIEPLVVRRVAPYFAGVNHDIMNDPRVEIVYDDARHFLATTREQFDIITSDPIHPWVKGAAKLYSAEYFELARERLKPGGLFTQWVPFYHSSREVVRSELATFFEIFPEGTVWGNDTAGRGYDTVLLGQAGPLRIDVAAAEARLALPAHADARQALAEIRYDSALSLLATYAGRASGLSDWLAGAEINRDRSLRLQYLAGLAPESREGAASYGELLLRRDFPADLFIADESTMNRLRRSLAPTPPAEPVPAR